MYDEKCLLIEMRRVFFQDELKRKTEFFYTIESPLGRVFDDYRPKGCLESLESRKKLSF